mgnify:CR=1 FL=1
MNDHAGLANAAGEMALGAQRAHPGATYLRSFIGTHYRFDHFRGGVQIDTWEFDNLVVTEGLNHLLGQTIKGQAVPGVGAAGYPDGRRIPRVGPGATTATATGTVVAPATWNGRMYMAIQTTTQNTGGAEPTWPTTDGGTVTDGSVTWQECSVLYIGLRDNGAMAAGDTMASKTWAELASYTVAADSVPRPAYIPGTVSAGSCDNTGANVAVFSITGTMTVYGAFLTDTRTKSGTKGLLYGVGDFTGGSRAVQSGDTLNVSVTTSITSS